ncbi:MAG: ATP-binding cassette domain-containing protein [Actinomycetota bacterium]|nr:ATP-binding cassette domain-containing protein [Actinomycetota bacterium]
MISASSISKAYGRFTAVDDVSFTCRPRTVTGFLGPNGAGKTTTLRILVGLTPPSKGTALIGGHPYERIPNPGLHVGVLLDASAQHAGRTGREVLALAALTMGLPDRRVDEMLDLVSLTAAESKRRVRDYSLGMRQRLGIAQALLGDPSILVLDEPANGLDPAGIHWMRALLREFADGGGTVLLSSHLLNEIEIVADEIILIGAGRILAQGTKADLLRASGAFAKGAEPRALELALQRAGVDVRQAPGGVRADVEPAVIGRIAAAAGVALVELRPHGAGLEEMFLELTAETRRERASA